MSEENNIPESTTEQVNNMEDRINPALNALQSMGGLSEDFMESMPSNEPVVGESDSQQTDGGEPQGELQEPSTEEQNIDQPSESETSDEKDTNDSSEGLTIESNIFGSEDFAPKDVEDAAPLEVSEGVSTFFKENDFGISESNFNERMPDLIQKEKEYNDLKALNGDYEKVFTNMPLELHEAVKSYYNKESDWDRHIKERISLDFQNNFENIESKDVVSKYFPGKISDSDWEEYNDPSGDESVKKAVNAYIDASKSKFENDKVSYNSRIEEAKNSDKNYRESFQNSFDSSRGGLSEAFKDNMPDKVYLETIDEEIKSGVLNTVFYNNDGTLKPDAHQRYIMARDGFDYVQKQREALQRKIATAERENILARTTDTPMVTKTNSTVESPDQELDKRVKEEMSKMMPKIEKSNF